MHPKTHLASWVGPLLLPAHTPACRRYPPELFYGDPLMQKWFRGYLEALTKRVNALTGVPYSRDPTILGWELANEPRWMLNDAVGEQVLKVGNSVYVYVAITRFKR